MKKCIKKLLGILLTVCLILPSAVYSPIFAQNDKIPPLNNEYAGEYTGRGSGVSKWASVNNSYIYIENGKYVRVYYTDGKLAVVYIDLDGNVVSSKLLSAPLPMFGGFFAGEKYNFAVFGQDNPEESDDKVIIKIVKYSKNFEVLGVRDGKRGNTRTPFDAGCLRMDEYGGILYIHTSHKMYKTGDGINHQANMSFAINEETMEFESSLTEVWNLEIGYVSHSFNQFIKVDSTGVYRVDHGDAGPRSVVLTKGPVGSVRVVDRSLDLVEIDGESGDNETGISVGGVEMSSDRIITAYTKTEKDASGRYTEYHGDIYLSIADKNLNGSRNIRITSYGYSSRVAAFTPKLVKINDNLFALMWTERQLDSDGVETVYMFMDADGKRIGSIERSKYLVLSDCQPAVDDDMNVVWYAGDGASVTNYYINPACALKSLRTGVYSHALAVTKNIKPTCISSGFEGIKYCPDCSAVIEDGNYVPALGHNFENGVCTRCLAKRPTALLSSKIDEENREYILTVGAKNAGYASSVVTGFAIPDGLTLTSYDFPPDGIMAMIQYSMSGNYIEIKCTADEDAFSNNFKFIELHFAINTVKSEYRFATDPTVKSAWTENGDENVFLYVDYNGTDGDDNAVCEHENLKIVPGAEPTCDKDGYTESTVCDDCGAVISPSAVIPAAGHKFVNGICSVCGVDVRDIWDPDNPTDPEPTTKPEPPTDVNKPTRPDNSGDDDGIIIADGANVTVDEGRGLIVIIPESAGGVSEIMFDSMLENVYIQDASESLILTGAQFYFGERLYTIIIKGDLNFDGRITASDAREMLRIASKLENADDITLTAGDLNSDSKISASEARSALRFSARLSSVLIG